jgi:hypothetical protein
MRVLLPALRRPTGALAGVAAADDRDLELRIDRGLGDRQQSLVQQGKQASETVAALGADAERFTETQPHEFMGLPAVVVGLVGEQNGPIEQASLAKALRDLAIERGEALVGVHHEEDQVRLADGEVDLPLDVGVEFGKVLAGLVDPPVGGVVDAVPAGVGEVRVDLGRAAGRVDRRRDLDEALDPVAGDARGRIDDRHPSADEAVEQARLAHVGPARPGSDRRSTPVGRRGG